MRILFLQLCMDFEQADQGSTQQILKKDFPNLTFKQKSKDKNNFLTFFINTHQSLREIKNVTSVCLNKQAFFLFSFWRQRRR